MIELGESGLRFQLTSEARYFAALLIFFSAVFAAPTASAKISYTISLEHPEQHLFNVTMTVPTTGGELTTAMPAWNTLYQIRNFAERIREVSATCSASIDVPLPVVATDKQTWRISPDQRCEPGGENKYVVKYSILWNDPGPFASDLNEHHAFINLAEILMYVPDRKAEAVSLQLLNVPSGWRIASALESPQAGGFAASSYDSLVDGPIEASAFDEFRFESDHTQIRVVLDGKEGKGRLAGYLRQITTYELQMMRDVPFDSADHDFTFLFHIGPLNDVGGGGMEHRNSTAIACASAEGCAEVAAHEFFHVWNVKRIRSQALEPVDYSREQYTRSLWFAEGVTSTYAALTLERTGLWTKDNFYRDLADQIAHLEARPARLWQSAEESSLDAWLEGSPIYNTPDRSISYYNKGQILGEVLDLAIRDATDDHRSLDDVMRRMNDEYGKTGKFYSDNDGIRTAIEEVAGKSFGDFFKRYVAGTDEIPYNDFLGAAGLALSPLPDDGMGPRYAISEIPHATDRQRRIREGLLRGTTD